MPIVLTVGVVPMAERREAAEAILRQVRQDEEFKQAAERLFLHAKLRAHDWNVAETARALDMPRSNLYKKLERHALAREPQEEEGA